MINNFKNEELKKVVQIAKENGYRVFASRCSFDSENKEISYVHVVSMENKIGFISAFFDHLHYSTQHIPCKEFGTGFGLHESMEIQYADIDRIKQCVETVKPFWAKKGKVEKYKDWNDFLSKNTILKYYEL